jgi:uncharacterized protein (TIGR02246 family)
MRQEPEMSRSVPTALILAATLAVGACAGTAPDTSAADIETIAGVRNAFIAAMNAEDVEKLVALYTDDGIRMEDNMPAISGRDAIRASYKELTSAYDCDISLTPEETKVAGDWAFDRGQFMMHMMPRDPKGTMIMDQGKYLVILQKQTDGSWKVAREIGNSNVPLPPPPAPAPAK